MSTNSPFQQHNEGILLTENAFVVIVRTDWNAFIVDELEKGCRNVLKKYHVEYEVISVPGAFEIPFAVQLRSKNGKKLPYAFITLGCVIRGDTPHFDYVCRAVTDGVLQLNLKLDIPTVFGVLTVDNELQAKERMGGVHGHKGEEAALTALRMIAISSEVRKK